MRPTLLRVLTDLYVQKLTHTPDEEQHYTELALRLLDAVDAPTRAAVAGRLARHLSPPLRVIQRLAADLPDVAAPLRAHPLLQPARTSEPASPIMPVVQTAVADEPADDRQDAGEMAPVIGADVAGELNELFFAANAFERRLILLNLDIVAPMPHGSVALSRDAAVTQRLEAAALSRDREGFSLLLAQSLRIPQGQARRIANDDLGEPMVTAAKALTMPRDVVYRILLFANTSIGHSVERVHALATLYDEITVHVAEHMIAIWQALQKKDRPVAALRPLLWDDEARDRARRAPSAVRRQPVAQRPGARREVS
jgi:hypothetical protein